MNKKEKLKKLIEDAAKKMECCPEDFYKSSPLFVYSDQDFMMKSFGSNIVMRGSKALIDWCKDRFENQSPEDIMDGNNLYMIENKLREHQQKLSGQHVCYLYLEQKNIVKPQGFDYRLFEREELKLLYHYKEYDNALCFDDTVDAIAHGAFYKGQCIALAAADDRNKDIFQIGIDTGKAYRKQGLGAYLVNELAKIIIKRGKQAIYTTWGANLASSNIAVKTGFMPVMVYYYAQKNENT